MLESLHFVWTDTLLWGSLALIPGRGPSGSLSSTSIPVAVCRGTACPSKLASACPGTSWLDQTCHLQWAEKVLSGAQRQPCHRPHPPLFTTDVVETREGGGSATPASCTPCILTPCPAYPRVLTLHPAHPTSWRQSSGLVPWHSHSSCKSGDPHLGQRGRCNGAQAGRPEGTRLFLAVWRLSLQSGCRQTPCLMRALADLQAAVFSLWAHAAEGQSSRVSFSSNEGPDPFVGLHSHGLNSP